MSRRAVDPGSAAPLARDPRGALEALAERTGVDLVHFLAARDATRQAIQEKAELFAQDPPPSDMSIVVFGSWARNELTDDSDDDWAVLARRPISAYEPDVVRAMALGHRHLGAGDKRPGAQDVFGVPFAVDTLVDNIGLDDDTNRNLTRRMLLLLESRELGGSVHGECWTRVLERYLAFGVKNNRPPRFLLNDLVRYWRTICVDFEGKHANSGGDDPKWVTRNAKLRTSRKLLFAGGLLPLLLCHLQPADEMAAFLSRWLSAPPADRLAAAFLHYDARAEGARTFKAYDRWIGLKRDSSARAELKRLRAATRDGSHLWHEIRTIGEALQRGLTALLFDTPLRPLAPRYAIF